MKKIYKLVLLFLSLLISSASFSQLVNGSFENNSIADLSSWEWTCFADSFNDAPVGCGSWCIQVEGGNLQGCFPGYAYQKIPGITDGQTFLLSGWAYAEVSPEVGIYFGKINNGVITPQAGNVTSATAWTQLSTLSSFSLSAGDTAVVILWGGLVTAAALAHGYFDCITLQHQETGISSDENIQSLKIFPNPVIDFVNITNSLSKVTMITISSVDGKVLKTISPLSLNSKMQIDVSDLGAGVYCLRVTGIDSWTVIKFLKL